MKRNLLKLLTMVLTMFSFCGGAFAQAFEDGEYYFLNVKEGTFLAGANSWGTQLSLKKGGEPMKLTWISESNSYTIKDVSLKYAAESSYVGLTTDQTSPNLFIDQKTPDGGYTITALTAAD